MDIGSGAGNDPVMRMFLLVFLAASTLAKAAEPPNLVLILADDLGFGDLGCYGQTTLATPNLDRLAAEGLRFTRHYAGSTVCAPSRCVLMTGFHTGHCSVRGNGPALMPQSDVTIPEVLKDVEYQTGCFGKWGIGNPPPRDDPNQQGFDEFYGYVNMFHAHNFYPPFLIRNGEKELLRNVMKPKWESPSEAREGVGVAAEKIDYAPDLIADEALRFIDDNKDSRFFLYYALNTPHANNEGGNDPDQRDGMEVPDYGPYANREWPDPEKGFAAMIRNIDRDVGRIVARLRHHGIAGNTLVMFTSDNGPHQEGGHKMEYFDSNGILRGKKRDLHEGGVRVPLIAWWPGTIEAGGTTDHVSGFQDFLPTFAELSQTYVHATDGISFVPTLLGKVESQQQHEYLYWEFLEQGGKQAILNRDWKAVRLNTLRDPKARLRIYDISGDPSETTDVAKEQAVWEKRFLFQMDEAHSDFLPRP